MSYNVAIIGGGPAGYTAAEAAGKAGLSVVLFEKNSLGGVCLNEGCIPTKTLLYSAKTYDNAAHASKYAVSTSEVSFDLPKIIARKQKVVRKLVLGVKAKLTQHQVQIVSGEAFIEDARHVRCGEEVYECEHLIICTGSDTFIPPIPGIDKTPYWTHRDALDNKELPQSLTIIGGGVIGMEFASFFNSLGVKVTVIEMMDEILGGMDNPSPVRQAEVNRLLGTVDDSELLGEEVEFPYSVSDSVKVTDGPFNGFSGVIEEVNNEKRKLKVTVKIFGRKTPLELSFAQVEKE